MKDEGQLAFPEQPMVEEYELQVVRPKCDTSAESVGAIATTPRDISPVFPYLNSVIKGCRYREAEKILSFRHQGCRVILEPHRMAAARFEDRVSASSFMEALKDLINRTWAQRHTIAPTSKSCDSLKFLDVYALLPKTNCGECGEATCMALAVKVVREDACIARCRPLWDEERKEERESLLSMLIGAGYDVEEGNFNPVARQRGDFP